jgi:hypothetical protein
VRHAPDFSPLDFHQRWLGRFSADGDTIGGRWETSPDGRHWELDFELPYHRLTAGSVNGGCQMATFVFVPGAGGVAWYWHRVVPLLEDARREALASSTASAPTVRADGGGLRRPHRGRLLA